MANHYQGGSSFTGSNDHIKNNLQGNNFGPNANIHFHDSSTQSERDVEDACIRDLVTTEPEDDREDLEIKKGKPSPEICAWVFRNETFNQWLGSTASRSELLWISGGAGMGKTMLSLYLSRKLERQCTTGTDEIFLFYFCDKQHEMRNTSVHLLRSLIYQMTQIDRVRHAALHNLLPDWRRQQKKLFMPHSLQALWRIFNAIVRDSGCKTIYCLVDAIDECKYETLEPLAKRLRSAFQMEVPSDSRTVMVGRKGTVKKSVNPASLVSSTQHESTKAADKVPSLRMIVVSREGHKCLEDELGALNRIRIPRQAAGTTSEVMKTFVEAKTEEISNEVPDKAAKDSITEALEKKGDGTYLYVTMAVERLKRAKKREIVEVAQNMPSTTVGLYCQSLRQVPPPWVQTVSMALNWIVLAARPLSVEEIGVGLSLGLNSPVNRDVVLHVIEMCGDLLSFTQSKVSIAHQTVREMLIDPMSEMLKSPELHPFHVNEGRGHHMIMQQCISYLETTLKPTSTSLFNKAKYSTKVLRVISRNEKPLTNEEQQQLKTYPLLAYATLHWPHHAKAAEVNEQTYRRPFFEDSNIRDRWIKTHWVSTHRSAREFLAPSNFKNLHVAAYFGITTLAQHTERSGQLRAEMEARNSFSDRPYDLAVERHESSITEFLILRDALDLPEDRVGKILGEPAVYHAAFEGDAKTLTLLLKRGGDPNVCGRDLNMTDALKSLGLVAWSYSQAIMYLWNEKKLDFDAPSAGGNESALHAASIRGHHEAAQVLIDYKAIVDSRTIFGYTPLHYAACSSGTEPTVLLLENGANIEAGTNDWNLTPLHLACKRGKADIASLLLDNGAQVDNRSKAQRTALHMACKRGYDEIVQLLLNNGAALEAKAENGITPLMMAAWKGNLTTVQKLLQAGADPNIQNDGGETAHAIATRSSQKKVASFLLQNDTTQPQGSYPAPSMPSDKRQQVPRTNTEPTKESMRAYDTGQVPQASSQRSTTGAQSSQPNSQYRSPYIDSDDDYSAMPKMEPVMSAPPIIEVTRDVPRGGDTGTHQKKSTYPSPPASSQQRHYSVPAPTPADYPPPPPYQPYDPSQGSYSAMQSPISPQGSVSSQPRHSIPSPSSLGVPGASPAQSYFQPVYSYSTPPSQQLPFHPAPSSQASQWPPPPPSLPPSQQTSTWPPPPPSQHMPTWPPPPPSTLETSRSGSFSVSPNQNYQPQQPYFSPHGAPQSQFASTAPPRPVSSTGFYTGPVSPLSPGGPNQQFQQYNPSMYGAPISPSSTYAGSQPLSGYNSNMYGSTGLMPAAPEYIAPPQATGLAGQLRKSRSFVDINATGVSVMGKKLL